MNAILVGADRLGNIPEVLTDFGIRIESHVTGRERNHQRKSPSLPRRANLLILFTDFLGHNVMKSYRSAAEQLGVPVVCCRRSVCSLREALLGTFGDPCQGCRKACERGCRS